MARPRPGRSKDGGRGVKFLNPVRDGAVLPILHLNGYKSRRPVRSHSRAQADRGHALRLIRVCAEDGGHGHGHEEGGGHRYQDRGLDPVNGPPERVPPG